MSIKFGMKLFEFLPIYTQIQSKYLFAFNIQNLKEKVKKRKKCRWSLRVLYNRNIFHLISAHVYPKHRHHLVLNT